MLDNVYLISTFNQAVGIPFNVYLIQDDIPTLIHTGNASLFPQTLEAIRTIMDPARLRYAFVSHFEADECGALTQLQQIAKELRPVCSAVGGRQLAGFDLCQNAIVKGDGDTLELGRRRLRFIPYPSEMHLWEGLLAYEETEGVLFTSDLFITPGPISTPVVKVDAEKVLVVPKASIPWDEGRDACQTRIRELQPKLLALGHGPVLDLRS